MTTSSAQPTCSTISIDTLKSIENLTITSPTFSYSGLTTAPITSITISNLNTSTYSYSNNSNGTISLGPIGTSSFNWQMPEEWKDKFPEWDRIQKMCEQYPGLKIAFEKFKTTYLLVKDDYDTPEDQRARP